MQTTHMIRTQLHMTPLQLYWLRAEAGRLGIAVAELTRRAIDDYIAQIEAKRETHRMLHARRDHAAYDPQPYQALGNTAIEWQ